MIYSYDTDIRRTSTKQRSSHSSKGLGLPGFTPAGRETGGSMLNISGFNRFYYIRNFTDMRCKHARILSVIRKQLHREPSKRDVFIVLSKDRRTVRLFSYDEYSCTFFEIKTIYLQYILGDIVALTLPGSKGYC